MSEKKEFQTANWFFTLNNPVLSPEALVQALQLLGSDGGVFQLEEAPTTKTPHYQGVVTFPDRKRSSQMNKVHPGSWANMISKAAAKKYCSKDETRLDGPWRWGWAVEKVYPTGLEDVDPYEWQTELMAMVDFEPDMRKIYWYWSADGARGKSSMVRWLLAKGACFLEMDTYPNMMCALAQHIDPELVGFKGIGKGDPKIVVVEATRSSTIRYDFLERLKDGYGFNSKYRPGMIRWMPCWVIVFANIKPFLGKDTLMDDRVVTKCVGSEVVDDEMQGGGGFQAASHVVQAKASPSG